ncbi:MAG TPA: peptide ABC transporter substrate-binding protein [Candidatus Paceibacterota bacterium]
MNPETRAQLARTLRQYRTWEPLSRLSDRLRVLPPGDKLVAAVLGAAIIVASVAGFYGLERALLVQVPARGGTLTEGEVGSPRFVNPLLALTDADRDMTALTYAGLMGLSGNGSLVPVLAENYTVSPDGKEYTFTIRQDARFSDGTPVTADDVVFTVQKTQDPALKSPQLANWSGILVEALDQQTVRFTLPKPYAPFLENTTLGILPAHLWREIADEQFPFTNLTVQPVGAGPFAVTKVVRDASGIITEYDLAASKDYALGRPYLDGINVKFYTRQSDLASALTRGEVESAYGVPTPGALTAPFSSVFGVFFNADQNPLFTHLEVRKALSIAIDREHIVNDVLNGYAKALAGPVPPESGIETAPVTPDPNRIADAAKTLEDAGWTYDTTERAWKNASKNLSFDSITIKTSNVPELKATASSIRDDWQKLGIDVTIELYEPGDLNQNVIRPRKYDALLFGMVVGRDQDLFAFWHSSQRNDPGLNIALYANKDVDALLEDARSTSDESKRVEDVNAIEKDVSADYPAAFTHTPEFVYAIPKNLHGVVLPQITTPADRFATVADWYRNADSLWPFLESLTRR